jgi:hypothetical protein
MEAGGEFVLESAVTGEVIEWVAYFRHCRVGPGSFTPSLSRIRCACRKSNPAILVMQSAEERAAKNTPCPLNSTR